MTPLPSGQDKKMKEDHPDSIYRSVSEEDISSSPYCKDILLETIQFHGAETEKLRILLLRYMVEIEHEYTNFQICTPKSEAPITPEAIRNLFIKLIAFHNTLSKDEKINEEYLIGLLSANKIGKKLIKKK